MIRSDPSCLLARKATVAVPFLGSTVDFCEERSVLEYAPARTCERQLAKRVTVAAGAVAT